MNELAQSIGTLLRPIVTPEDLLKAQDEVTALIKRGLKEGLDYGPMPGVKADDEEKRMILMKPGAESLLMAFGLFSQEEIIESEIDHDREFKWTKKKKKWTGRYPNRTFVGWEVEEGISQGLYRYVTQTKLYNRHTGELVGSGIASCSSMESKFIDRPRDSENTILRISCKRSLVAAVIITFRLSDRFTADMETAEQEEEQVAVQPVAPPVRGKPGESAGQRLRRLLGEDSAAEFEARALEGKVSWSKVAGSVDDDAPASEFFEALEKAIAEKNPVQPSTPTTPETHSEPEGKEEITGEALRAAAEEAQAS